MQRFHDVVTTGERGAVTATLLEHDEQTLIKKHMASESILERATHSFQSISGRLEMREKVSDDQIMMRTAARRLGLVHRRSGRKAVGRGKTKWRAGEAKRK